MNIRAPSKNWADECSSDEGSIDEEHKEDNIKIAAGSNEKSIANSKLNSNFEHESENKFVACINNFHVETERMELGTFFVDKGCTILNLELFPIDVRKSNRSAKIKFANAESLKICLNLSGEKIRGMAINTSVYETNKNSSSRVYQKEQRDNFGKNRSDFDSRSYEKRQDNNNTRKKVVKEEVQTSSKSSTITETPVSRPRIIIQPRTLPLDTIGQILVAKPEIFGGGRPQDEQVYKQEKDKLSKDIVKQEIPVNTVFQTKSLNETSNHVSERSDVAANNITVNSQQHSTKIENKIITNPRESNKYRDNNKLFKDRVPKALSGNEKAEEVQKDSSYVIIKPDDNNDKIDNDIPTVTAIISHGSKSSLNVSSTSHPSKLKQKERPHKKIVRDKSTANTVAAIDDVQQDNLKKLTISKQGNKHVKSSENNQPQATSKKVSESVLSTVSAEQIDIERFHKAQERIGDKFERKHSSVVKVKKIVNNFAALNNSDSEDD